MCILILPFHLPYRYNISVSPYYYGFVSLIFNHRGFFKSYNLPKTFSVFGQLCPGFLYYKSVREHRNQIINHQSIPISCWPGLETGLQEQGADIEGKTVVHKINSNV